MTPIRTMLLCAALLSSSLAAQTRLVVPMIDDDAEATWRQLTWDDFRKDMTGWGREVAGIASQVVLGRARFTNEQLASSTGDEPSFIAKIDAVEAYAVMSKLESGHKAGGRSDYTLAHEQAHFDITEVCARRFRKTLSDLSAVGKTAQIAQQTLEAEMARIYNTTVTDCQTLQAQYDGETIHGTKKKLQKQWLEKIAQWLVETSE